jgi:hypothetical protein
MGTRGSSLDAKVKDAWCYTSIPIYNFMAWYLAKHRDNYLYLYI